MAVVSNEGCPQAGVLAVGEPFDAGAQDIADPGERIILASAVAVDVLLDAAAVPNLTMWSASRTVTSSWSRSAMAFSLSWNGSSVATFTLLRNVSSRACSQVV